MESATIPSSLEISNSMFFAGEELAVFKKQERFWTRSYLGLQILAFAAFLSVIFGFIPLSLLAPIAAITFSLPFVFLVGCVASFPIIDNGMTLTVYVKGLSEISTKEHEEFIALGNKFKNVGNYLSRIESSGRSLLVLNLKLQWHLPSMRLLSCKN